MGGLNPQDVAAWVERSCAAQGVPVHVRDPLVVEQVRVLLTGRAGRPATARQRGRSAQAERSQPPDRLDAVEVEVLDAGGAGADDSVVEDRPDDRGLPGQVQSGPRSA